MTRALLILALVMGGCAPSLLIPPEPLRHEPDRPFVKFTLPSADIANACRGLGSSVMACSTVGTVPLRILPNDASKEMTCLLTWHENGHINEGWLNSGHSGWEFSTKDELLACLNAVG